MEVEEQGVPVRAGEFHVFLVQGRGGKGACGNEY
jgi:hypothetical protein